MRHSLWQFSNTFPILNIFSNHATYPMLTVISPAKTLDFDSPAATKKSSQPTFSKQTKELVSVMRSKTEKDLSSLMRISPKLAALNVERFKNFKLNSPNGKQAILAFKGDVYLGIDIDGYSERDFTFAQKNLRILSGLYGVLKPLDLIQPYRLEMGTKLSNKKGTNLYDFWDNQIRDALTRELAEHRDKSLINLASNEYFKAVKAEKLDNNLNVITPVFKDYSNGSYRILSFFAKKARGSMASFIVHNRLNKPEDLKSFKGDGYTFNKSFSSDETWVFTRKGQ